MLSINISELIWTIVCFFLLYFSLKHFLFEPIIRHSDARKAQIEEDLTALDKAEKTVAKSREEADKLVSEASNDVKKAESEARNEFQRNKAEALKKAEESISIGRQNRTDALQKELDTKQGQIESDKNSIAAILVDIVMSNYGEK